MFDEEGHNVDIEIYEEQHELLWDEFRKAQQTLREKIMDLRDKGKELFVKECKTLFQSYPELKSFGWTQYTPYFMDGDPCVFYANTEYFYVNGYDSEELDVMDTRFDEDQIGENLFLGHDKETRIWDQKKNNWNISTNSVYNPKYELIIDRISDLLGSFSEDDFFDFFGDHAMVVISEKGAFVEDWDHE